MFGGYLSISLLQSAGGASETAHDVNEYQLQSELEYIMHISTLFSRSIAYAQAHGQGQVESLTAVGRVYGASWA